MEKYQRPILTVDVVILTLTKGALHVLLTERDKEPFAGTLALPGGYLHVEEDMDAEDAATRVLASKANARNIHFEQLRSFSGPYRDPRGYSVTLAYLALVPEHEIPEGARLVPVADAKGLAFDHDRIVEAAVERLRRKSVYSSAPAALIASPFTLADLSNAFAAVSGVAPDPSSFRRKILAVGAVVPSGESSRGGRGIGRGAALYRLPDCGVMTFNRTF